MNASGAVAGRTAFELGARLRSGAVAMTTGRDLGYEHCARSTEDSIFERNLQVNGNITTPRSTSGCSTATSEHIAKNITEIKLHATLPEALLEPTEIKPIEPLC